MATVNLAVRILHNLSGELFRRAEAEENGEHACKWLEVAGHLAGACAKTLAKFDAELDNDPDHP